MNFEASFIFGEFNLRKDFREIISENKYVNNFRKQFLEIIEDFKNLKLFIEIYFHKIFTEIIFRNLFSKYIYNI